MVTVVQSAPSTGRFHWTVEVFYRAVAAGVFDEPNRLELVNGDLWERELNPPHSFLTEDIARLLRQLLEPEFWVREEKPFHIADDGEPVPDVAVVAAECRTRRGQHPGSADMWLLIEVTDTTVERDTVEKVRLYGAAGIPEYWVVLLNPREVLVYRNPIAAGYPDPLRLHDGDTVSPLAAPGVTVAVSDLLPRPTAHAATA